MRYFARALAAAALLLAATAPLHAAQDADIAGEWDITIVGEAYTFDMIASFVQAGTELTGTLNGPNGERQLTGAVEGNEVTFSVTIPSPEGDFRLDFSGELDGENLSGKMSSPNSDVDSRWSGTRRAAL